MNHISQRRASAAFTLIELLTVIAIIGILAALIVGGASIAVVKARQHRVEAERESLVTAIESYKKARGYYPPSNTNSTMTNSLFYELTGGKLSGDGVYFTNATQEVLSTNDIATLFYVGGILNASSDTNEPAKNFYGSVGKGVRTAAIPYNSSTYTLFAVNVPGPASATVNGGYTLWNYVSNNPTNNPNSFDLWMDVVWSGKTNRISNWSKDPQPL